MSRNLRHSEPPFSGGGFPCMRLRRGSATGVPPGSHEYVGADPPVVSLSSPISQPVLSDTPRTYGTQQAHATRDTQACAHCPDRCMGTEEGGDGSAGEHTGPARSILRDIIQIINMEPFTCNLLCCCPQGRSVAPSHVSPGEKEPAYAAGCRAEGILGYPVYPGDGDFLALPLGPTATRACGDGRPLNPKSR